MGEQSDTWCGVTMFSDVIEVLTTAFGVYGFVLSLVLFLASTANKSGAAGGAGMTRSSSMRRRSELLHNKTSRQTSSTSGGGQADAHQRALNEMAHMNAAKYYEDCNSTSSNTST